jgi:hypothetical protein
MLMKKGYLLILKDSGNFTQVQNQPFFVPTHKKPPVAKVLA